MRGEPDAAIPAAHSMLASRGECIMRLTRSILRMMAATAAIIVSGAFGKFGEAKAGTEQATEASRALALIGSHFFRITFQPPKGANRVLSAASVWKARYQQMVPRRAGLGHLARRPHVS